jgi:hypothetical protein
MGPELASRIIPAWTKKKYYETLVELDRDREARYAGLTPLQRLDAQIRDVDALLAEQPEHLRSEYAANQRRAELLKARAVAERDQKIRELAEQIKAARLARAAALKGK